MIDFGVNQILILWALSLIAVWGAYKYELPKFLKNSSVVFALINGIAASGFTIIEYVIKIRLLVT